MSRWNSQPSQPASARELPVASEAIAKSFTDSNRSGVALSDDVEGLGPFLEQFSSAGRDDCPGQAVSPETLLSADADLGKVRRAPVCACGRDHALAVPDLKAREAIFPGYLFDQVTRIRSEVRLVNGVDQVVALIPGGETSPQERGPLLFRGEEVLPALVKVIE